MALVRGARQVSKTTMFEECLGGGYSYVTPEQLRNGAVAGHVFETFVVSKVLKSYMNADASAT